MHTPMMAALALIKRYKAERTNHTKYYGRCGPRRDLSSNRTASGVNEPSGSALSPLAVPM